MNCCSGEFFATAAALVAIQVAQGRSSEEIALLGTFFTALGDNLALMTVSRAMPSPPSSN